MDKIVLITGATAGIGKATALKFAENGYNIIITGRRKDRLKILSSEIKKKFNRDVFALNFDIRNLKETESAINSIPEEWKAIDVLINNAGLAAGFGTIDEGNIADWETHQRIALCFKIGFPEDDNKKKRPYNKYWLHCRERSLPERKCLLRH